MILDSIIDDHHVDILELRNFSYGGVFLYLHIFGNVDREEQHDQIRTPKIHPCCYAKRLTMEQKGESYALFSIVSRTPYAVSRNISMGINLRDVCIKDIVLLVVLINYEHREKERL